VLNWHPIYADIAQSEDFGYTTGPWEMTDNGPQKRAPIHGHYFSVWKKQNDGEWKVVVDLGIQHPAPQQKHEEQWQTSAPTRELKITIQKEHALGKEKEALLQTDRAFAEFAHAQGYERALLEYSTANARWYRPNQQPLLEKAALQQYYRDRRDTVAFTPSHGEVARSTDLGYTLGSYEFSGAHTAQEKGYYVRMWKKVGNDKWRLVLEVISPVSEGQ
jgi:ketosteroid isomerase-like protein